MEVFKYVVQGSKNYHFIHLMDLLINLEGEIKFKSLTGLSLEEFCALLEYARKAAVFEGLLLFAEDVIVAEALLFFLLRMKGNKPILISASFNVPGNLVNKMVLTVASLLKRTLQHVLGMVPEDSGRWRYIERQFFEKTGKENVIGAMGGCRFEIPHPKGAGCSYLSKKKNFSINCLAVADSNCNILYANVGACGSVPDNEVFDTSPLKQCLRKNELNVPSGFKLLADLAFTSDDIVEAFSLNNTPEENKQISLGLVSIERAFGLMKNQFNIFRLPPTFSKDETSLLIMTAIVIHNFLIFHRRI